MKNIQKLAVITGLLWVVTCCASQKAKITEVKKKEDAEKMEILEKNKARFEQQHKNDLGN